MTGTDILIMGIATVCSIIFYAMVWHTAKKAGTAVS
jgi:hypothetical protein